MACRAKYGAIGTDDPRLAITVGGAARGAAVIAGIAILLWAPLGGTPAAATANAQ
jgi:hypothetical protein